MFGAIAGDIIGMPYEKSPIKTTDFPLFSSLCCFTDDTVLTVAVADVLIDGGEYTESFHRYFALWSNSGFGETFYRWAAREDERPYYSFGNGSAMRVSPVGWAFDTMEETLEEAARSASVTHNHPEGIKGAQATAAAIYLGRNGHSKEQIAKYITHEFHYAIDEPLSSIRPWYQFDITCQGTVPIAIRAFLEGRDWEEAVRLAVSMGGDSDTLACITGSIAEAFYGGVPEAVAVPARKIMENVGPSLLTVADEFAEIYIG